MLDDLKRNASARSCQLCLIIWRAISGVVGDAAPSTFDTVEIWRKEERLKGPLRVDILPSCRPHGNIKRVKLQMFVQNSRYRTIYLCNFQFPIT